MLRLDSKYGTGSLIRLVVRSARPSEFECGIRVTNCEVDVVLESFFVPPRRILRGQTNPFQKR